MEVPIHPDTHNPTVAWKKLSKTQRVIKVTMTPPHTTVPFDKARIVCMSDTHSLTPYIKFDIPDGDIFVHAGDFTNCGQPEEVVEFNNWIGTLPHKHKLVIAGNHELSFDESFTRNKSTSQRTEHPAMSILPKENIEEALQATNIKQSLTNCRYIEDELITIYGLNIYGTPWQPEFCKWAFNVPRGRECLEHWNKIPEGIDILISHSPPIGHGDLCISGQRAGCVELLTTVQQRVKPKYHVFGHIHEGYGVTSDGRITFINASTCNVKYAPNNPPIVFDIPLPKGFSKDV